MSILKTMLRNMWGGSARPAAQPSAQAPQPSAPRRMPQEPAQPMQTPMQTPMQAPVAVQAATRSTPEASAPPAFAAAPATAPRGLSPDRIYSLDVTPPMDYEPGFDLDWPKATLTEIADHFKTDKGNIKHRYTEVYARYFEPLRNEPLWLMEIGVACGTSLKTWSKYFPNANVLGVDIRPECATLCRSYPQIQIAIGDATAIDVDRDFDIIVDDGSHVSVDIVETLQRLWPRVKPGGYFVIEDLNCTHDSRYQQYFTFPKDPAAFDRAHFIRFIDNRLREMDGYASDIEFIHFYRQVCVIRKHAA